MVNWTTIFSTDLECSRVLQDLEEIDDELDDFGIPLVTTIGIKYAGTVLKVRKFPSLGLFRNGQFLLHEGSLVRMASVRIKMASYLKNMGHSRPLFRYFRLFNTVDSKCSI